MIIFLIGCSSQPRSSSRHLLSVLFPKLAFGLDLFTQCIQRQLSSPHDAVWNCPEKIRTPPHQLNSYTYLLYRLFLCFYRRYLGKLASTCFVKQVFNLAPAVSEARASQLRLVLFCFTAGSFHHFNSSFLNNLRSLYFFYTSMNRKCLLMLQISYDIKFLSGAKANT